jgi:hypothetical protein
VVLPPSLNLSLNGTFAPYSSDGWLTVNGTTGGVVDFSFTTNSGGANRQTAISLLNQTIPITQRGQPGQTEILYVSDAGSGCIYAFAPDGARTTFASGLGSPAGLVFDRRGDLFAPDFFSGIIYKFMCVAVWHCAGPGRDRRSGGRGPGSGGQSICGGHL